ncbi:hypothetical protein G6F37_001207 [Rhizopus arrhizus]|nr:hypothetical protein G6F37_001207 [Rhizopus arrhizus]
MGEYFFYENGKDDVVDESRNVHFEMNIDSDVYPIDHITNVAEHLDYKSQEKRVEKTIQNTKRTLPEKPIKEENEIYSHRKHDDATMTSGQKGQENTTDVLEPNNRKNVGRPAILNEVHKKCIIGIYDDNLSARPDQAMNSLANEFAGLMIGKIAVYNFMKNEAAFHLSLKRPHGMVKERDS